MAAAASTDDDLKITPEFLESFNRERGAVEATIEAVRVGTSKIDTLIKEAQAAFSPDDLDRISKLLQQQVKLASDEARKGKKLLDDMKKTGDTMMAKNPKAERLQPYKSQYMRLCKLYVDVMKEHQRSKETMRKTQTDTLIRRGEIVYGDSKSREEIRTAVEADPGSFLRDAILTTTNEAAQEAYTDALSRARDVEMLVRSLNEVAQMFQDLAVLVNQQSEMLDSIETHVESAQEYVKKGNANLRQAIEYSKKTRKCYCCMLVIVIAIVIALVAGLGGFFSGAFKTA